MTISTTSNPQEEQMKVKCTFALSGTTLGVLLVEEQDLKPGETLDCFVHPKTRFPIVVRIHKLRFFKYQEEPIYYAEVQIVQRLTMTTVLSEEVLQILKAKFGNTERWDSFEPLARAIEQAVLTAIKYSAPEIKQ